jgi:hypothetical protein
LIEFAVVKMVNVRFRGVELEESAKSEEARRRNPTAEAERELLDSLAESYLPDAANIGQSKNFFAKLALWPYCCLRYKSLLK